MFGRPAASPLLVSLACIVVLAVLCSSAQARTPIRVGLGDQSAAMFDQPLWQQAKLKRSRYFISYNAMDNTTQRLAARNYVLRARRAGVSVLLHISSHDLRPRKGLRPSTDRYRIKVGRLVRYFRGLGVRDFGVWNEANHVTQETYDSPRAAASFFKTMYRLVKPRCASCAVVALDVLDQDGARSYMQRFYRSLSATWRRRATVVGIHNYSDVNRSRSTGTGQIIRTARAYNRATQFWMTETGAVAAFGSSFAYSEARQARRMSNMFLYARRYRSSGVKRVYAYNFFGTQGSRGCATGCPFDAGLVNPDGTPRPVYAAFRRGLGGFLR